MTGQLEEFNRKVKLYFQKLGWRFLLLLNGSLAHITG